ncbi:MAG TPA: 6,7-dimethyl-8-ribityllumazine synthase [Planctomycetaceae bacterium]|nr:6,7-dimethyl-8-ribityllumazine synthase [Planctomycetaceae bacterium]
MIIYEGKVCPPPGGYIAIVVAKFNRTITRRLLDGAIAKLLACGTRERDIRVAWVPGAFELPIVADRFVQDGDCRAVICLGAVIKGETSHDEHINRAISTEFARMGVESGVPVIFGVLTCNTVEQAIARSGGDGNDGTRSNVDARFRDKVVPDKTLNTALDTARGTVLGNKGAEAAEAALEMIDLLEDLPDNETDPFEMLSGMVRSRMEGRDGDFDDNNFDDNNFDDGACTGGDQGVFRPPAKPRKKNVKKTAKKLNVKKSAKKKS